MPKTKQFVNALPVALILIAPGLTEAAVYDVGPGKPLTRIGQVPWKSLLPGDRVNIHWQATPYKEKWVVARAGTAAAPITISGVANATGQLPIIDGAGATTVPNVDFWNQDRMVIKFGGSSVPSQNPDYVVIENLEIRGAKSGNTFINSGGVSQAYAANAAGIMVENGMNLTIRRCTILDNGNGIFVGHGNGLTSNIKIEGNYILDNGYANSSQYHNTYTESLGIVYQFNRFGPLKPGSQGNNIKDRSAGTVIRYNWVEGGNYQLDLVESTAAFLTGHPSYRETFVYGNVLIENAGSVDNASLVHYGGDTGNTALYRSGWLYFHYNTCVSFRTDAFTVFGLNTNSQKTDARNNLIYGLRGPRMIDWYGQLELRSNWLLTGWFKDNGAPGTVVDMGGNLTGTDPLVMSVPNRNFSPRPASPLVDASGPLGAAALLGNHNATLQYVPHQSSAPRMSMRDNRPDIGAFELNKLRRDAQ